MQGFVDTTGVGIFPNINDEAGELWVEYEVTYQPAFVLVAANGSIERFGALSEDELQQRITASFS